MGTSDSVCLQHADGVIGKILYRIIYLSRRVLGRAPRIPMVISDDIPPACGELAAKILGPPYRRSGCPHDEEDNRVRWFPEGFGVELHAIGFDRSVLHRDCKSFRDSAFGISGAVRR